MTKERKDQIVEELVKALIHFKVYSEEELNRRVGIKLEDIECGCEKTIRVGEEEKTGYLVSVAIKDADEETVMFKGVKCWHENAKVLCLLVGEETIEYVMKTAETYAAVDGSGVYEGEATYESATLETLEGKYYAV